MELSGLSKLWSSSLSIGLFKIQELLHKIDKEKSHETFKCFDYQINLKGIHQKRDNEQY